MRRVLIAAALSLALAGAAHGFGLGLGNRMGRLGGSSGAGTTAQANLRIINTGDFRIINTADNRAISP